MGEQIGRCKVLTSSSGRANEKTEASQTETKDQRRAFHVENFNLFSPFAIISELVDAEEELDERPKKQTYGGPRGGRLFLATLDTILNSIFARAV